jgi:hypothetical protein
VQLEEEIHEVAELWSSDHIRKDKGERRSLRRLIWERFGSFS